jgi:hypothetical protein
MSLCAGGAWPHDNLCTCPDLMPTDCKAAGCDSRLCMCCGAGCDLLSGGACVTMHGWPDDPPLVDDAALTRLTGGTT